MSTVAMRPAVPHDELAAGVPEGLQVGVVGADHGLDKLHSFVKEGLVVVVRELRLPVPRRIEVDPVLGLRDGDLKGFGPSEAVPALGGAIVSEETIADWPDHTR